MMVSWTYNLDVRQPEARAWYGQMSRLSLCSLHQEEFTFGEHPRKLTIRNAWFQQWNTGQVLWWFGQQYRGTILSRNLCVTIDGVWIGEWNYWPLVLSTSEYSAIVNLYALQITTAPAKPFSTCRDFISRSLTTTSNSGDFSASRPQVLSSQPPVRNSTLNWQLAGSPQLSSR
jgi:hypothetical protein